MTERVETCPDRPVHPGPERPQPGTCIAVVCPDSAVDAGYFAAGLARFLASRETGATAGEHPAVALVDGLPGTGGLDLLADLDEAPGARWSVLRGADGPIDAQRLLQALPTRDGVAVLAHDRAVDVVEHRVRGRTMSTLAESVTWLVGTQSPDRLPERAYSAIVLLVRGSVAGMAAAQRYVDQLGGEPPIVVVSLETPAATRIVVADSLRCPIVTAAPTRWRLSHAAGAEVTCGAWPGSRDRVLRRLLEDVGVYLLSRGRSAAWV